MYADPATPSRCGTFAVHDVAEAPQRVEALGGSVIHPGEASAICKDSEGSLFGLTQAAGERELGPASCAKLLLARKQKRVARVLSWSSVVSRAVSAKPFVPDDFDPPRELELPEFHLVPLGAQHNESDHSAWTTSIAHIRATPGFESSGWPPVEGMSLDANRRDLERHARDFAERTGFTFTVLRPGTEEVIGCLYIYAAQGRRRRCGGPLLGSR